MSPRAPEGRPSQETVAAKDVASAFEWAEDAIRATRYGEVLVAFILHDGEVTRIKRIVEESSKVGPRAAGSA